HRVRSRVFNDSVTAYALDKNACLWEQSLGFDGSEADDFGARLHAESTHLPAAPRRAGPAKFLAPALFLLVVFAGSLQIDTEKLRTKQCDHDRRSHGAEHIGHGICNRYRID